MARRHWLQVLVWPLLAILLDVLSKSWATGQVAPILAGPLQLTTVRNHGFILGSLAGLPDGPRIIGCSMLFAMVVFVCCLAQFLFPWKALPLRVGLNVAVAGVLGNFADRIRSGYVTDFIRLDVGFFSTAYFNLADACQLIGIAMVAGYLLHQRLEIFYPDEKRKGYWVNPRFQLRYCAALGLGGLGICFALILLSAIYWSSVMGSMTSGEAVSVSAYLIPYLWIVSSMAFLMLLLLAGFGVILSHRIAGPMYALERFLSERKAGRRKTFRLREGDDFKQLEEVVNELLD